MFSHSKKMLAMTAALSLGLLGACSSDNDSDDASGNGSTPSKTLKIGVPSGWDEGVALSNLTKSALEDQGYTVELDNADIGIIFTGLARGDYDLLLDGWLPVTHKDYIEQYGDDIEDLGTWYDDAKLTIAVNNDSPVKSLADLKDNADVYNNEIIGIDAGAGLTRVTQDEVIPTYGLENMNFKISSTAAMLAELDGAMSKKEDIVVTLWRPHWAYGAYDIRDLEDPEGALGGAEEVHSFARKGFSEDYPEVAEMFKNLKLSSEELSDVENYMLNENASRDNVETATEWLKENSEVADRFKATK